MDADDDLLLALRSHAVELRIVAEETVARARMQADRAAATDAALGNRPGPW